MLSFIVPPRFAFAAAVPLLAGLAKPAATRRAAPRAAMATESQSLLRMSLLFRRRAGNDPADPGTPSAPNCLRRSDEETVRRKLRGGYESVVPRGSNASRRPSPSRLN